MISPRILTATVAGGRLATHEPQVPVPWWSLTKTALAAAALALVARGQLSLDAPAGGGNATLRQLLQHTAGIAEYGALPAYQQAVAPGHAPWRVDEPVGRVDAH